LRSLIDRYVLRQLAGASLIVVGVLTGIVWLTSSLRQLDLLVTHGSGFLQFLGITTLVIPLLLTLITPFALFIATVFVLNKLNADSELIVLSAIGMSRPRLVAPFVVAASAAAVFMLAMTLVVVPATLREVREQVTAARANLITYVIQPGRFTSLDYGLTIHVRDRGAGGQLFGVFISDTRDPNLEMVFLGTRGAISRTDDGTFLVLQDGDIIRKPKTGNPSMIAFDSYAFNLSALLNPTLNVTFPIHERSTLELAGLAFAPGTDEVGARRVVTELSDRIVAALYALCFPLVAFAALGAARTTRQSRGESIALAIVVIMALRVMGFLASALAQRQAWAVPLIYAVPLAGIAGSAAVIFGRTPKALAALSDRLPRLRLPAWPPALLGTKRS
jgi:lipopolysaccharide export system permease protein